MRESDVFAMPQNDDWEISYCTFSNGHDGVYNGGLNCKFHHNLVEHTQDDGIYLSPMYPSYKGTPFEIHVFQNVIRDVLTAIAFGGPEKVNTDPHGEAWMIVVKLGDPRELDGLMDAAQYEAYAASETK
jgi:hypothetical protein